MKLTDLDPLWVNAGGEGVRDAQGNPVPERHGVGVTFDCPCGDEHPDSSDTIYVAFQNPLDGGPAYLTSDSHPSWERTGDTFEMLTLIPSILRRDGCRWHGFVTNGEIILC